MEDNERTEIWASDPFTGKKELVEVFDHALSEQDLRDFAVAAALQHVEHLTLDDLFRLR